MTHRFTRAGGKDVSTVSVRATRRALTGIIAVVMVLGLAGCGGDGDDEKVLGAGGGADMVITDLGFEPNEFEARVGDEVNFRVANRDKRPHTFTLTFLDVAPKLAAAASADSKI